MRNTTLEKQSNSTASIVPDISLMKKMASISGTIPSRILELVDNSIDALIPGHPLKVEITVTKKGKNQYIKIKDNGSGMTEEAAKSFFKLGSSIKEGTGKIGKFGLGAKVAILGLGDKCFIKSSPLGLPYKVDIDFDINNFSNWEIEYQISEEEEQSHGTEITIEDITVRVGDVEKFSNRLSEQLSKTYKHFILNKQVKIFVNDVEVNPQPIELIEELYQEFDFLINNKRVYGWAGATINAGTNWKFGFELINHGRIIKSNDLLGKQAHTSLARLVGEIHLDDFPTDIHKTDFMRDNDDFQEMQNYLINDVLSDLLNKISRLTNKEVFSKYKKDINKISSIFNKVINMKDFLSSLTFDDELFKTKKGFKNSSAPYQAEVEESDVKELIDKKQNEKDPKENSEKNLSNSNKTKLGFTVNEPVLLSLGEEQDSKRWNVTQNKNDTVLNVEINMDHPTFKAEDEIEVYMKNAVMDSIAEFIVKEEKKHNTVYEDEIDRLVSIKDLLVRYSVKLFH